MNLSSRFADLVGCTLVHCDASHVVFWTGPGNRVFLRYELIDNDGMVEAGSYMALHPPVDVEAARELAKSVSYC